jgi:tetratricopeptide (TPR) repeat protein
LNNLAECARALGRYGEAESLYLRALEILERASALDVLYPLSGLAELYCSTNALEQAKEYCDRTMRAWEAMSEPDCLANLELMKTMANVHEKLGRIAAARALRERAEKICAGRGPESNSHH